ncbi:TetR/AcrR family transcriptional regulator [Streptomyces sp. NPDC020719]|uniref:TetR/AcrR family transcriptional regulator n=1 Tax=Streptomyces sp. NPDC020719 TaxID=3154896 RepID=UPI0033F4A729
MIKQDRALRTHRSILDAAAEEFSAQGYAGTQLQSVVRRTGLTKGALYGHFSSKAELADELVRRFDDDWRALLRRAEAEAADGRPLAALRTLVLDLVGRIQNDVRFAAALRLTCEDARTREAVPVVVGESGQVVERLARQARQCGEISPGRDVDTLARLLLAAVFGLRHTTAATEGDCLVLRAGDIWDLLMGPTR